MDDIIGIGIDILILLDFLRMVYDHIGLEVKLGCIQGEILSFFHGFLEIFFNLVFQETIDGMVIEIFPFYTFVRVNS